MDGYITVDLNDAPQLGRTMSAWGNTSLLQRSAIGVCGSRKASESGLNYALELGRLAPAYGLVVVSGYAGGVDQQAHMGALESGGQTVAVLAEGLSKVSLRSHLRDLVTSLNFLALSEFAPDAPWTSWRAMKRNKTILAIAEAMFVVEAGETGGTMDAGREALRLGKPLFVLDYTTDRPTTKGNRILLELGGRRIANMRELKNAMYSIQQGELIGVGRLM